MIMLGIVILNWNGFQDTIECIESLLKSEYQEFRIYLIDNFSTDGSQKKLQTYILDNNISDKVVLILNTENSGFAIGSNIGIRKALEHKCSYIWLLNNDTIVMPDTISKLINFMQTNKSQIVTPKILYYSEQSTIWNCGGKLCRFGFKRYYFNNQSITKCPDASFKITFVTNCASMFESSYFIKYGLLSEKFFFGEEDFEMSLRNLKNNVSMYCVPTSIIYHKVSSSICKDFSLEKKVRIDFLYYLNRMIDMKLFFNNSFIFKSYFALYRFYIVRLLKRKSYSQKTILSFVKELKSLTSENNSVDKKMFDFIMNKIEI